MLTREELKKRFPVGKEAAWPYQKLAAEFCDLAEFIGQETPEGRSQSIILTKLEEAFLWTVRAIEEGR